MLDRRADPHELVWAKCPNCGFDDPGGAYLLRAGDSIMCHCRHCHHIWWWQVA